MTKFLFVLRHAQSAGKQSGLRDYDRILTPLGENNSLSLGENLKQQSFKPDLILASAALRVVKTVELINKSLGLSAKKIEFKPELYEATTAECLDLVRDLPDETHQVMIVGHNPTLSVLSSGFAGRIIDLAPAELIGFKFEIANWKNLSDKGEIILHHLPK